MKRTPPEISRKRQEIRQKADIWRAGIAAARAAGEPLKVAYGLTQVAMCAKEMKNLIRSGKMQFWKS